MMRRLVAAAACVLLLAACSSEEPEAVPPSPASSSTQPETPVELELSVDGARDEWVKLMTTEDEVPDEAVYQCDAATDAADGYWCSTRYQMADNDQRSIVGYVREDTTVEIVHINVGQNDEEARESIREK